MEYTIAKWTDGKRTLWQVLGTDIKPSLATTDEQTTWALARELLHKTSGNVLYFRDFTTEQKTLIDKN